MQISIRATVTEHIKTNIYAKWKLVAQMASPSELKMQSLTTQRHCTAGLLQCESVTLFHLRGDFLGAGCAWGS